jgi:hypothetical protein
MKANIWSSQYVHIVIILALLNKLASTVVVAHYIGTLLLSLSQWIHLPFHVLFSHFSHCVVYTDLPVQLVFSDIRPFRVYGLHMVVKEYTLQITREVYAFENWRHREQGSDLFFTINLPHLSTLGHYATWFNTSTSSILLTIVWWHVRVAKKLRVWLDNHLLMYSHHHPTRWQLNEIVTLSLLWLLK